MKAFIFLSSQPRNNDECPHLSDDEVFGAMLQAIHDLYRDERVPISIAELGRMALAECLDIAAVSDRADTRHEMINLLIKKQRRRLRANRPTISRSA